MPEHAPVVSSGSPTLTSSYLRKYEALVITNTFVSEFATIHTTTFWMVLWVSLHCFLQCQGQLAAKLGSTLTRGKGDGSDLIPHIGLTPDRHRNITINRLLNETT
jgi:hypothetical protein